MTVARLKREMSLTEFAHWLKYLSDENRAHDPNAPIDLSNASPEVIRRMFAGG